MTTKKRTIEIFTARCPACQETIDLVNKTACPSCGSNDRVTGARNGTLERADHESLFAIALIAFTPAPKRAIASLLRSSSP
jgi:Zn ribbon nucleic-acid-binding protein